MVSTTEWQADASLWKDDIFFDAGTFCLPSRLPQASLEAYTVVYDLETGIHDVFLTIEGILGLFTSSTSSQSSHVAEFSNGVMKAVPRCRNGSDSAGFPTEAVNDGVEECEPHLPTRCEEISPDQQGTCCPAFSEVDAPIVVSDEPDSTSSMKSNTKSIEEHNVKPDNLGALYSPKECPEKAKPLNILTDLVLEDDIPPSTSSASDTSSDNSADTPSKPTTNATSPTLSVPQDLFEFHVREREASAIISALDLEENGLNPNPWQCIPFQWLDMAITDRQYCHWEEIQEKEEPEFVREDEAVDIVPRLCGPTEVERPLRLKDLYLDAMVGQSTSGLEGEGLPQEAVVLDDEAVAEHDTAQVETTNDYQLDGRDFHHRNLLGNPVYQASRTPSALSLWVIMTSKRRAQIEDCVSLKAVVSSQATKWVDPVLLEEGVSVPEEVRALGNATACRNFLTGLTTIQYEPYGTWQSDTYDHEQEIPYVMDSETKEIFDNAYSESHGFPGLQRPCSMKEHEPLSYSFSNIQLKQRRGWESSGRLGDSNLRFVLDKDSITSWHAPASTSTTYDVAEATECQVDEDDYVENSLVVPADESQLDRPHDDDEADARFPRASSSLTRAAMSPPQEGRFFTPRLREDSEESDDLSDSVDDEFWETDENGVFVSPKKGKERLRGEMGEDCLSGTAPADEDSLVLSGFSLGELPSPEAQGDIAPACTICQVQVVDTPSTGIFRLPEPGLGPMNPTDGATKAENALPMSVEGVSSQEDVLQAKSSLPYCKYNDVSEISLRPYFAATIGQAAREFGRWFTENMLW